MIIEPPTYLNQSVYFVSDSEKCDHKINLIISKPTETYWVMSLNQPYKFGKLPQFHIFILTASKISQYLT